MRVCVKDGDRRSKEGEGETQQNKSVTVHAINRLYDFSTPSPGSLRRTLAARAGQSASSVRLTYQREYTRACPETT